MQIANPIYDVVFKYLLDDNRIAKLIISAIIGEEIEELDFRPTEYRSDIERKSLTVYRLDFTAKIKTTDGYKQVIIEIQKAKFPTDIMRFRKYLAEQYASNENVYKVEEPYESYARALPIISIYLLGHTLDHTDAPVIRVARKYYNVVSGEEIKEKEEFIESLTHDSFIIQIPYLKDKRQSELLMLLSVFDQSTIKKDTHILNIKEEEFPEKYQPVIRRLQKAILEPKVRKTMDVEDEILKELENLERIVAKNEKIIGEMNKTIEEKEKAIEEKEKAIEEKEKTIGVKEKAIGVKEKAIEENEKAIEEKDKTLKEKDKTIEEKDKRIEELERKLKEKH